MAFFFNAIAPLLFALSQPLSADDAELKRFLSGQILICTASGYKYISIDDAGGGDTSETSPETPHCPLCIIAFAETDAFLLADFAQLYLGHVAHVSTLLPSKQKWVIQRFSFGSKPRAPPYA